MSDFTKQIEVLVNKASDEHTDMDKALRYSQAACNIANAMRALHDIKREKKTNR